MSESLSTMEAISGRRSVRAYTGELVDEVTVRGLLDAAVLAPTAMHREPWVFAVVQDPALLKAVSEVAKRQWSAEHHELAAAPGTFAAAMNSDGFNIFYDAGTLIVVGTRTPSDFAVADCWLAAENLMLAACARGYGSCVIGSAVRALNDGEVKAMLGLPQDFVAIAPVIVGKPVGKPVAVSPALPRRAPVIASWKRQVAA